MTPFRSVLHGTCLVGGRHPEGSQLAAECPVLRRQRRHVQEKVRKVGDSVRDASKGPESRPGATPGRLSGRPRGAVDSSAMAAAVILLLMTLLAAGCVSSVPLPGPGDGSGAVYVHPQTGEVRHCENPRWTSVYRGGILAASAYADCKTAAEEQGFVRRRDKESN